MSCEGDDVNKKLKKNIIGCLVTDDVRVLNVQQMRMMIDVEGSNFQNSKKRTFPRV